MKKKRKIERRSDKKSIVHSAMYNHVQRKGYVAIVDILMDTRMISKQDYERWRIGEINCLEKVSKGNLRKINALLSEMRAYAIQNKLKIENPTYLGWGKIKGEKLRFTVNNSESIEKVYSTHFVETKDSKNFGKKAVKPGKKDKEEKSENKPKPKKEKRDIYLPKMNKD